MGGELPFRAQSLVPASPTATRNTAGRKSGASFGSVLLPAKREGLGCPRRGLELRALLGIRTLAGLARGPGILLQRAVRVQVARRVAELIMYLCNMAKLSFTLPGPKMVRLLSLPVHPPRILLCHSGQSRHLIKVTT